MEEKKQFLKMALSCLRNKNETESILKMVNKEKPLPTEHELGLIREGLVNGNIDDNILKKFFPTAYEGVSKYGLFKFYFSKHNESLVHISKHEKLAKLADWCRVHPGKILEKTDSEWIIERADGKQIKSEPHRYNDITLVNENELKTNSYVALHRGKIHMILTEEEFETALNFYNKFQKELKKS